MQLLTMMILAISSLVAVADKGPNFGLDICDAERMQEFCQWKTNAGDIYKPDLTDGYAVIQTACENLAGPDHAYIHNERRSNCFQTMSVDKSYKFDFNIQRTDSKMFSTDLDMRTCVATTQTILTGGACENKGSLGGRLEAGLFMLAAVPNPGLCAGTKPLGGGAHVYAAK